MQSLPTAPVIIGHSLGGFMIQNLQNATEPAAVLIASGPLPRRIASVLRSQNRQPLTGVRAVNAGVPSIVESRFVNASPAQYPNHRRASNHLQEGHFGVIIDVAVLSRVDVRRLKTSFLAAARTTGCIPSTTVRFCAGAESISAISDMGHDMMLEPQ